MKGRVELRTHTSPVERNGVDERVRVRWVG